jgi:antitoxin MazE
MNVEAKIQKWGNGLGLRISGILRGLPNFVEGTIVNIEVTQEGFAVKKMVKPKKTLKLPYTEAELLEGLCSHTAHADLLAKLLPSEHYD